jgi:tetratricopeptide (TPR) repeat protein
MAWFRRLLLLLLGLGVVLGLLGAVGATLGKVNWGDSGWYYHPSADYRLRSGQEAIREGDSDRAERIALALEEAGAGEHGALLRGESLYRRGKALADAGNLERAAPYLQRAVEQFKKIQELGPLRWQAAEFYGLAALALGQRHEAERGLRYVVEHAPDSIDAHRGLAALYFDQGALTTAVDHLERVAELDPSDGRPHRFMGYIYKDLKQNTEAIRAFGAALERSLGPAFEEDVKENLAEVLVRHSDYQDALRTLDTCTPDTAARPRLIALRAEALWALQQTGEACRLLDQALAEQGSSPELLRQRGEIALQENQPDKAAVWLEQAAALDRQDLTSRQLLARTYEALGQKEQAARYRQSAQQIQETLHQMTKLSKEAMARPWDAAVRKELADVSERLDRPDLAAMWRQAAASCPQSSP